MSLYIPGRLKLVTMARSFLSPTDQFDTQDDSRSRSFLSARGNRAKNGDPFLRATQQDYKSSDSLFALTHVQREPLGANMIAMEQAR